MMKHILYIFLFILSFPCTHASEHSDSLFNIGNQYYTNGQYDKAINTYHLILATGYEAAGLYYNLGNAYYKTYENTLAVYYYEKAFRMAPHDKDIKHNLEVANMFIVDKIDVLPEFFLKTWINNISRLLSMDGWAYLSLGSFVCFLILLLLYLFTGKMIIKKTGFSFAMIMFFVSIITYGLSGKQKQWMEGGNEAIIYSPTVNIKSSPDEKGKDLFILHEGTKVRINKRFGEWNEIELPDGNKGWILLSDILII